MADWNDTEAAYATNLPAETEDDIVRLSALMGVSDSKTKHCAGQTLEVIGVAVDWGPHGESEEGEMLEGLRGHILLADGKSIFTTSMGVLRALRLAMRVFGLGVWRPPVLVEIRAVPSRKGEALVGILRGRKAQAGKAKK